MKEILPPIKLSERERQSIRTAGILAQAGISLMKDGRISSMEIDKEHDVHAYFRSQTDPRLVVHIQAYPGFGNSDVIVLQARQMDYQRLMEIRTDARIKGGPSIGNEHRAVVAELIPQTQISPNVEVIANMLDSALLEPYSPSDGS